MTLTHSKRLLHDHMEEDQTLFFYDPIVTGNVCYPKAQRREIQSSYRLLFNITNVMIGQTGHTVR